MKIRYDREVDILTIELGTSEPIDHAEQNGSIILPVSLEDKPVLLEVLEASEFMSAMVKASMLARPVAM